MSRPGAASLIAYTVVYAFAIATVIAAVLVGGRTAPASAQDSKPRSGFVIGADSGYYVPGPGDLDAAFAINGTTLAGWKIDGTKRCVYTYTFWKDGAHWERIAFCTESYTWCQPDSLPFLFTTPDGCRRHSDGEGGLWLECEVGSEACRNEPLKKRRVALPVKHECKGDGCN